MPAYFDYLTVRCTHFLSSNSTDSPETQKKSRLCFAHEQIHFQMIRNSPMNSGGVLRAECVNGANCTGQRVRTAANFETHRISLIILLLITMYTRLRVHCVYTNFRAYVIPNSSLFSPQLCMHFWINVLIQFC